MTSLLGSKYSASPLKKILADTLKDLKVTESVTDLLITTFNTKTQQPVFFDKQVVSQSSLSHTHTHEIDFVLVLP